MTNLPIIGIFSYEEAEQIINGPSGTEVTHVISINDPERRPPRIEQHRGRHLFLRFHDVSTNNMPGTEPPTPGDVQAILGFASAIQPYHRVLVHCAAGISRSSAAALSIIASKLAPSQSSAQKAVEILLQIKPTVFPNLKIVAYADRSLGYAGRLHRQALAIHAAHRNGR